MPKLPSRVTPEQERRARAAIENMGENPDRIVISEDGGRRVAWWDFFLFNMSDK